MTVDVDDKGQRWSNQCDLCRGTREVGVGYLPKDMTECPWCRAVRMKYGKYWYPIDKSNEHLFVNQRAKSISDS